MKTKKLITKVFVNPAGRFGNPNFNHKLFNKILKKHNKDEIMFVTTKNLKGNANHVYNIDSINKDYDYELFEDLKKSDMPLKHCVGIMRLNKVMTERRARKVKSMQYSEMLSNLQINQITKDGTTTHIKSIDDVPKEHREEFIKCQNINKTLFDEFGIGVI